MRKAALALSVLAAAPAALLGLQLFGTALSRAFFGTMTVCAAGGPECHSTVAEPSDFLGMAPYFLVFLFVALGSLAGGVIALRRPLAGAVVLVAIGVLGAGTILLFIPPFWTVLDLVAAGLAFGASRQRPPATAPQSESRP
jgi:hypothetical protein